MVGKILINVRSFKKQQLPEAALTQFKTSDFCKLRSIFNVDVSKCFFNQNKIHQPPNIRNHTAVLGAKSNFRNKQDVIVCFDEYRVSTDYPHGSFVMGISQIIGMVYTPQQSQF